MVLLSPRYLLEERNGAVFADFLVLMETAMYVKAKNKDKGKCENVDGFCTIHFNSTQHFLRSIH